MRFENCFGGPLVHVRERGDWIQRTAEHLRLFSGRSGVHPWAAGAVNLDEI